MSSPIVTLPATAYFGDARHRLERAGIFAKGWHVVAHEAELPPGTAVAREAGAGSWVILRDAEGTLHGHKNVCRHRAGPLWPDGPPAPCTALRCRYHGWRYALDGCLTHTPDFGASVDPETMSLHRLAVRAVGGLIFASADPSALPMPAHLATLEAALTVDLSGYRVHNRAHHDLRCNWKTYVENYLEGYHIPTVHPGLRREVEMSGYRVHVRGRGAVHEVPMKAGVEASYEGTWVWLWPNVALNVYGGAASLERMIPTGPSTMRIEYLYLLAPGAPAAAGDAGQNTSSTVTHEDIEICEAVQRNLESGAYDRGLLSPKHEAGVAAFQRWVREAAPLAQ